MYELGRGVLKDAVTAYAWYSLSHFNGDRDGFEKRDSIAKKMTFEQIAQAKALLNKLMEQILKNKTKQAK